MTALGFGSKMCRVVYFLYENSQSARILDGELTRLWDLGRSVRQGFPLSAMLYAIATHPLLLYLDYLTTSRHLHGLKLPFADHFVAQAYADDSMSWPKNRPEDVQCIMKALHFYGLAAGLQVNFQKSKLLSLRQMDWHSVSWPGEIVKPDQIVRHLGYPLAYSVHNAKLLDWVENKLRSKLHY
ncbi:hypothetical protein L7F22_039978 [Adiantum nelumboides]|nr:hypothetical protein [Adiantum nelumboides]